MAEYEFTLEGRKYESIGSIGWNDYDWHNGALLRRDDGALFWFEDSGCSCTCFGEDVRSEDDFTPVTSPHAAVELAKESFSDEEVCEFARQVLF